MTKSSSSPETSETQDQNQADIGWSSGKRTTATIAILLFLFVVIIAPLSNPIGSEGFSIPLAKAVSPFHRALFLGHGYRFFGPDPGPSHLIYYTVTRANGDKVEGHFPDPEQNWPRLLYHRWFMLSETIFEEHKFTPDQVGFEQAQQLLTNEILAMRDAGEFTIVKRLEKNWLDQQRQYENARRRIDELVNSLAKHLTAKHDGKSTELFVRERLIAGPLDVSTGIGLDDKRYLMAPIPIGPGLERLPDKKSAPQTGELQSTGNSNAEGSVQ